MNTLKKRGAAPSLVILIAVLVMGSGVLVAALIWANRSMPVAQPRIASSASDWAWMLSAGVLSLIAYFGFPWLMSALLGGSAKGQSSPDSKKKVSGGVFPLS